MSNIHIISVLLATIILIIIAESQKLRKISWILLISCIGYIILILTPDCSVPKSDDKTFKTVAVNPTINHDKDSKNNAELFEDNKNYEPIDLDIGKENILTKESKQLSINTIRVATDIVDREPKDPATLFLNDVEYLYCYTSINNPFSSNTIIHHWYSHNIEYFNYSIEIGKSDNWRCWSRISIKPELAGDWKVIASDSLMNELAEIEFTLLPTEE